MKRAIQKFAIFLQRENVLLISEVNGRLQVGLKNNRTQLRAKILTNSKYFIKNNSITPSVKKETFLIAGSQT